MAALAEQSRPLSDEDWLVCRVKTCIKSDPYAAKAWLITAKTLFPRHFAIQYEAYNLEKSNKNVAESAKLLEEMFLSFPQEPQLRNEIQALSDALQSDETDEKTQFQREVFSAMPSTMQCHMLLRIKDSTSDMLEQCRLLLVVLRRYPSWIPDQGVKLVENLLSSEKHARVQSPVNCYRKYLVCDVLPLVLNSSLPDTSPKHIHRWLQKAIEYYVSYLTHPPPADVGLSPTPPDLLSPTKVKGVVYPGSACLRRVIIPGVPEKECYIAQPWERLTELLHLAGSHLKWNMAGLFTNTSLESQWQHLHSLYEASESNSESNSFNKQVLYCGMVLFLRCLYSYTARMDPEQFAASATGSSHQRSLVLIEGFKAPETPKLEHRPKKLKAAVESGGQPGIVAGKSVTAASEITLNFLTAMKCWDLLNTTQKEFNRLLQHWKTGNWHWLKSFKIDVLVYQGQFQEAISQLQAFRTGAPFASAQLRTDLQQACCYYCLGNFVVASDLILAVINSLPQGSEPSALPPGGSGAGRQLQLLPCSNTELLPYCVRLLITCLKSKAFQTDVVDDMSLGHMIVLLQYDWPQYESLFMEVVARIQQAGSFTYSIFFNYIINIDILEEFAYLRTQEGGRISLDILPTSTKVLAQQRTVTRGVNKGVKEDFKVSMERQVSRSKENIETVIRHFLTEEKSFLRESLAS